VASQRPLPLAWAEHERARFFRACHIFAPAGLVTPGASTPAFDVNLRAPEKIAGQVLENYMGGSLINAFATLAGCPAVAVPCGFDQYGRPVGLQIVAPPRQDAKALQVAALLEKITGSTGNCRSTRGRAWCRPTRADAAFALFACALKRGAAHRALAFAPWACRLKVAGGRARPALPARSACTVGSADGRP